MDDQVRFTLIAHPADFPYEHPLVCRPALLFCRYVSAFGSSLANRGGRGR
jgi:hypothetical protein